MKQSNEKIFGCELLTYDQQDQKNNEQQEKNVVFAKVMDNSKQLTLPDLLPNSRPMRTAVICMLLFYTKTGSRVSTR